MRLHSLKISGFRRIKSATVHFGDATFLIGSNNSGKSTVFKAIDALLSAKKTLASADYYSILDPETGETKPDTDTVVLEAEFRNLPTEAHSWKGFKGRIFSYAATDASDSGLSITYRKTYAFGKDVVIEIRSRERTLLSEFQACKTAQDLINSGAPEAEVVEAFPDLTVKIGSKGGGEKLEQLDVVWQTDESSETWFQNPGGIPGVVLKMLPRIIIIPADTSISEIESSSGVLGKTLNELFEDVRDASVNYKQAQAFLNSLAKELDPANGTSEFGLMMTELNGVLVNVFPDSKLHATASLSDPNTALKPTFSVEMSSNVRTPVSHQGAGMIRAAAFGMLRFRQKWLSKRESDTARSMIVCFEEPEIYLHPSAANKMRDTIYDLSGKDSQIVATTHSPFIIDLSRKPRQILNSFRTDADGISVSPFNITEAYVSLTSDDKDHMKMLVRVDEHVARVFFTKHVVIVEGDTEEVAIKETLKRLPKERYLKIVSDFEIVKARGKASIIGLTKYLVSMGIFPIVVHDRDAGIAGAEVFNEPIAKALAGNGKVVQMHENIEDELGYQAPSADKPFRAFRETAKWGDNWSGVPDKWKSKMAEIFDTYVAGL